MNLFLQEFQRLPAAAGDIYTRLNNIGLHAVATRGREHSLKITATMTDDTQVEIEFEDESQYYHHVVEAEEGTGNLMTVI